MATWQIILCISAVFSCENNVISSFAFGSVALGFFYLTVSLDAKPKLVNLEKFDPFFLCADIWINGTGGKNLCYNFEIRVSPADKKLQGFLNDPEGKRYVIEGYDQLEWRLKEGLHF